MNIIDMKILLSLKDEPYRSQRVLAERTGYAVGTVNKALKDLVKNGFVDDEYCLTSTAEQLIRDRSPERAVILAAGFGMRMVPINTVVSKGLLEVNGEALIERQIKQLHEAGIVDIAIVVGFMKERYDYLIDKYRVKLIVNSEYIARNNIHSMVLASDYLSNAYIVPCDIWCRNNPFCKNELYCWYMVTDRMDEESEVRINRKEELVKTEGAGNSMIGIAYITGDEVEVLRKRLVTLDGDKHYINAFWEEALYQEDRMIASARMEPDGDVVDVNTYEILRELDEHSTQLDSGEISSIAKVFDVESSGIRDIRILKKGMTNRSFVFSCKGNRYVMRIPGEGTDRLINRKQEAQVYEVIKGRGICDDPVYLDAESGYKISRFISHVHSCDVSDNRHLVKCMSKLKEFHRMKLKVDHSFDLFGKIEFYESLWQGKPSIYRDYRETKAKVFSLKSYIAEEAEPYALSHIDSVPDNFLFSSDDAGQESLQLTDWEYAAMCDQDVDLAMFIIYSGFTREQADYLIDIYFDGRCPVRRRLKIYCYIAASGLLWSNWCEYKRNLGVEFGAYSLIQYRYAKDFYRIVTDEFKQQKIAFSEVSDEGR